MLVEELRAINKQFNTVLESSDQLIADIKQLSIPQDAKAVTLDVISLYPLVDREHFMSIATPT
eukprot:5810604-Lingulodinium_polyedra.AAC.1